MAKWEVTGLVEDWKTGKRSQKSVKVIAPDGTEAIRIGMEKLGTHTFISRRLIQA